jgi:BlaI family transcriptional regulator, penicillinase repressor
MFGPPNLLFQISGQKAVQGDAMKELTDRELEVMHAYWERDELTANEARDQLAAAGHDLAYVTVANLTRILVDKGFLVAVNDQRPFRYRPAREFAEVSRGLVGDMLERVFRGSREQLLVNLFGRRKKLTAKERTLLEQVLREQTP